MVSMINEPVTSPARAGPRIVTTGISAFLSMWRTMITRSLRPLARAVRI